MCLFCACCVCNIMCVNLLCVFGPRFTVRLLCVWAVSLLCVFGLCVIVNTKVFACNCAQVQVACEVFAIVSKFVKYIRHRWHVCYR